MYNLENIGKIIQGGRKHYGWTQYEFSSSLNVSPQAVSKWETGVGYPDISLLPDIAALLNCQIDDLFKAKTWEDILKNQSGELASTSILQPSPQVLKKVDARSKANKLSSKRDLGEQEECKLIQKIDAKIAGSYSLKISQRDGEICRWRTKGNPDAVSKAKIYRQGDTLYIRAEANKKRYFIFFEHNLPLEIEIFLSQAELESLSLITKGWGKVVSDLKFGEFEFSDSGASDLDLGLVDYLSVDSRGASNINLDQAKNVEASFAGAGNLHINEMLGGNFYLKSSGASDCKLKSGLVNELDCHLKGAGNFRAKLTAQTARLTCSGVGSIVVDRVIGSSKESSSPLGYIKVKDRS